MGCLIELFFEIFVEGILELIGYGYIKLMTLIVPDKAVTERTKEKIRTAIIAVAAVLAIAIVIGITLLIQDDPFIKNIGRYVTYIPLAIIVLQVVIGIIVKVIRCFRRK